MQGVVEGFGTDSGIILAQVGSVVVDHGSLDVRALLAANSVCGVVAVLNFHLSVARNIDVLMVVFVSLHTPLNFHVKLEGLVGLLLTIGDAEFLAVTLGDKGVTVDAVEVALTEEQLRETRLLVDLQFVERI